MNIDIYALVLALSINEMLHVLAETFSVRAKVKRLSAYIAHKPVKESSIKIDTRAKSYAISIGIFVVILVPLYLVLSLLALSSATALAVSATALVLSYLITALNLHEYHVAIEKVTKPFMGKK